MVECLVVATKAKTNFTKRTTRREATFLLVLLSVLCFIVSVETSYFNFNQLILETYSLMAEWPR